MDFQQSERLPTLCFVYLEKQTPISALIGAHELSVMFRAKGERLKISLELKGGGGQSICSLPWKVELTNSKSVFAQSAVTWRICCNYKA